MRNGTAVRRSAAALLCWLAAAAANCVAQTAPAEPRVVSATCAPDDCRLGHSVTITFQGLNAWMAGPPAGDISRLDLALNGVLIKGLHPKPHVAGSEQLEFPIQRDSSDKDNRTIWDGLLSKSAQTERMLVGVSVEGGSSLWGEAPSPAGANQIDFIVVPHGGLVLGVIFLALLLLAFLILAHTSNIVRDPGPDLGEKLGSFSLARTQMAWWLFIIMGAYVYIFLVTGEIDSVTQGVLILMGISSGAGLVSAVVDSNKQTQRKTLETERTGLTTDVTTLSAQVAANPPNAEALKTTLAQKNVRMAEIATSLNALPLPTAKSEGFLMDILSDDAGVSFHRFQMAAWTLVLGVIFMHQVWSTLAMPDFSATLLGLMGISSGTYLGFKIPDNPK